MNRPPVAFIYLLIDPFTGQVRYVGKSIRPKERLANHCNEPPTCHRTKWIHSVVARGGRPVVMVVDKTPADGWQDAERGWIAYGRREGWPLTNGTDGGDGVSGLSGEAKERMARAWVGRKHRPESLEKIGRASRGRRHTEEYKQFMRGIMSARVFTDEHRRRLSVATRKLEDAQVEEIGRRLAAGETGASLATAFRVHRTTISKIKTGRYYATAKMGNLKAGDRERNRPDLFASPAA